MKTFLYLVVVTFLLASCKKIKNPSNPSNTLPPYTETGVNTFGCTVDGNVFLPGAPFLAGYQTLQCNYQLVNGVLYFTLAGRDFNNNQSVGIHTRNISFEEKTLNYASPWQDSTVYGQYSGSGIYEDYYTSSSTIGELNIKHFDSLKQIISGTFWFDAIDSLTGKKIQIRDGRFDVHYTR